MSVKMSGLEYRRFLRSDWGPDATWEDYLLTIDGQEVPEDCDDEEALIRDSSVVVFTGGIIIPDQRNYLSTACVDAEKFARRWLKQQTTTVLMVEVNKEDVEAIKRALIEVKSAKLV